MIVSETGKVIITIFIILNPPDILGPEKNFALMFNMNETQED